MRTVLSFEGNQKLIADGHATRFVGHINQQVTHGEVKVSCDDVVVSFPDGSKSVMTKSALDFLSDSNPEATREIFLTDDEKAAIGEVMDHSESDELKEVTDENLMKDTIPTKPGRDLRVGESFDAKTGMIVDEFGLPAKTQ